MVQPVDVNKLLHTEEGGAAANIYAARALRDFGDGFAAVLLPAYLAAIGLGPLEIGVVATVALLSSSLLTLGIGYLAGGKDRRILLVAASGLMIATGLAYAQSSTYAFVLLVAFLGTINPSSGSVSIFVPLEHALLSRLVTETDRTRAFARYSLIGALAAAVGALAATSPDFLAAIGMSRLTALRAMFVLYAVLGGSAAWCTRVFRLVRKLVHRIGPQRRLGRRAALSTS